MHIKGGREKIIPPNLIDAFAIPFCFFLLLLLINKILDKLKEKKKIDARPQLLFIFLIAYILFVYCLEKAIKEQDEIYLIFAILDFWLLIWIIKPNFSPNLPRIVFV